MKRLLLPTCLLFLACLLFQCAKEQVAGTTVGVDNPEIKLSFKDSLGTLAFSGKVAVYQSASNPILNNNPVFSQMLTKDSSLIIRKENLSYNSGSSAEYNIFILSENNTGAVIQTLKYDSVQNTFLLGKKKTSEIVANIKPIQSYRGSIQLNQPQETPLYAFLPGSPYYSVVTNKQFFFPAIPHSSYKLQVISSTYKVYQTDKEIKPNDSLSLKATKKIEELDSIPLQLPSPKLKISFRDSNGVHYVKGSFSLFLSNQNPLTDSVPVVKTFVNDLASLEITPQMLSLFPDSNFNLIVQSNNMGTILKNIRFDTLAHLFSINNTFSESQTLQLKPLVQYRGKITTPDTLDPIVAVYLPGTNSSSPVTWEDFLLTNITPSTYTAKAVSQSGTIYSFPLTLPTTTILNNIDTLTKEAILLTLPLAPINVLTPLEVSQGFDLLFDGYTPSQWKAYVKADSLTSTPINDLLQIKNQELIIDTKEKQEIRTLRMYGDFEFRCDFKIDSLTVSGVLYRVDTLSNKAFHTGPEFSLVDQYNLPVSKKRFTGGVNDLYAPSRSDLQLNKFNQMRIICLGNHVEHWLNGKKVLEYELKSQTWKDKVAQTRWKNYPNYGLANKGYIALQTIEKGGAITYRNIRVASFPLQP